MAKHSKVLSRYRLAMALEGILRTDYPAYVEIPREIEQTAYVWSEYARGDEQEIDGGEINKFVGGKMFFVKFGSSPHDPIWPIDLFSHQVGEAQTILGCMLSDAINGFPVPFYPQSLQRAYENATLVVRFGAINDRKVAARELITASLADTGWQITQSLSAGTAARGRRQALHFAGRTNPPLDEWDIWATNAAGVSGTLLL